RRLGHLDQTEHALLHARATAGHDGDDWQLAVDRFFERQRDLLTGDRAHAAAEEPDVDYGEDELMAADAPPAGQHGLLQPGALAGLCYALAVGPRVGELQRIHRDEVRVELIERALIE